MIRTDCGGVVHRKMAPLPGVSYEDVIKKLPELKLNEFVGIRQPMKRNRHPQNEGYRSRIHRLVPSAIPVSLTCLSHLLCIHKLLIKNIFCRVLLDVGNFFPIYIANRLRILRSKTPKNEVISNCSTISLKSIW